MSEADMAVQLPLGIALADGATFDNYLPGENAAAVASVRGAAEAFVYLWGARGTGRTHLLQAACHAAVGDAAAYLPLAQHRDLSPELLEGLEHTALVCLDDIDAIVGIEPWELGLFHLYNRLRESGTRLLVAADRAPAALALRLPDLTSRLGWGPVFQLHALTDTDKLAALQLRARGRGLELPDDVGHYLLRRCPRDMHSLFHVLDVLDRAALAAQRRLTIPFVREQF